MESIDYKFLNEMSLICHKYIIECRSHNKDPNEDYVPLLVAIFEAELNNLRDLEKFVGIKK